MPSVKQLVEENELLESIIDDLRKELLAVVKSKKEKKPKSIFSIAVDAIEELDEVVQELSKIPNTDKVVSMLLDAIEVIEDEYLIKESVQ
jgi:hypothetical protein